MGSYPQKISQSWIGGDHQLWPMQAFFNAIPDEDFVRIIRDMVYGIGCGFDGVVCSFPSDLDPGDEVFVGAEFYVYNTECVIVDNETLLIHIRRAIDRHVKAFPDDGFILDRILEHSELT